MTLAQRQEIGRRLAAFRGIRSLAWVSDSTGLDPTLLSRWEHGKRRIGLDEFLLLLTTYRVTPAQFFRRWRMAP